MSRHLGDITIPAKYLFAMAGLVASTLIFLFATFATLDYVDARHESVMEILKEIKEYTIETKNHVTRIEERQIQIEVQRRKASR